MRLGLLAWFAALVVPWRKRHETSAVAAVAAVAPANLRTVGRRNSTDSTDSTDSTVATDMGQGYAIGGNLGMGVAALRRSHVPEHFR